jgi:Tfp pilus assembly protein PilO
MGWLSTIDPKRVPLFAAALVVLVAAALTLYVVIPQAKARRAALAERTSLAASANAAAALAAERATLEEAVRSLVTAAGQRDDTAESLAASLIARLQELAARHAVDLVVVEPNAGVEIAALRETTFDVELIGEYDDVVAYLRDVRSEIEPLVVRELSLMPLDESPQPRIHAAVVAAAFGEAP